SLTPAGKQALDTGYTAAARSALARGLAAQARGNEIDALLNYSQAIAFDPGQMEAIARLESLSTAISGGTLTQRITADVAARKAWLEAFKSAAAFFNDHPPFEITFDPALEQVGKTDYERETVNLAMLIRLAPSEAGWTALNTLVSGLDRTGRRETWGFTNLPFKDPKPSAKDAVVFGGKKSFTFKVDVALVNEKGKTVSRGSASLASGSLSFSPGASSVTAPDGETARMQFSRVNVNDLTDTLTIVISAVNGIPSHRLSESGYMRIANEPLTEPIKNGTATDYFKRAYEYDEKKDYDRAILDYTQVIRLNPLADGAYNNRGLAYEKKGDYDRAIADYTHAIMLNPNYAGIYYNRGNAYRNKGDYDQAIADYTQAIRLKPDDANAYSNRGNAYSDKGDYDRAIADYEMALKIDPND
ncbi:MAG: tetratricopeptide repeat protein, partial [Spirochaetaceae bacterium]|nr:tetratricopeptide repeat protein [Spirochaetaceae bacterium]